MDQYFINDNEPGIEKIAIMEIFPPEDDKSYYFMDDEHVIQNDDSDSEFLFQNLIEEEYVDGQDNKINIYLEISQKTEVTEENTKISAESEEENEKKAVENMEISTEEIIDDTLNDEKYKNEAMETVANTGEQIIIKRGTCIVKKPSAEEPVLKCILCWDTFPSERILKMHHWLHTSCTKCKEQFLDTNLLLEHFATCPKPIPHFMKLTQAIRIAPDFSGSSYICDKCGKTYSRRPDFVAHLDMHNLSPRHRCAICDSRFYAGPAARSHMLIHMQPHFECKICNKKFKRNSDLQQHNLCADQEHMFLPCECKICNKKFKHSSDLRYHTRAAHQEQSVTCGLCGRFVFSSKLTEHQDSNCKLFICTKPLKTLICPICNEVVSRVLLRKHLKVNHNQDNYDIKPRCRFCNLTFENYVATSKHYKTCPNKYLTFDCEKCGKICFTQKGLKLHKIQCEKPRFECKICNLQFMGNSRLQNHNRDTHQRHSVTCSFCGLLVYSSKLTEHQDSNCELFIYTRPLNTIVCPVCEKVVSRRCFRKHMKVNHNQDKYQMKPRCRFCNLVCETYVATSQHYKICPKKDSFNCEKCGKICFTLKGLKLHEYQCKKNMQSRRERKKRNINETKEINGAVNNII